MTSKLTREFMQNIISGHGFGVAPSAVKAMAEYIVAAMDSEPVGYFGRFDPDDEDLIDQCSKNVKGAFPLYRHAQQPVVPATLPCSVELKPGLIIGKGCKTETLLTALRRRADYSADIDAMTPEERAENDASIKALKAMLPKPAAIVPEDVAHAIENLKRVLVDCNRYNYCSDAVKQIEDACRAAMLSGGKS